LVKAVVFSYGNIAVAGTNFNLPDGLWFLSGGVWDLLLSWKTLYPICLLIGESYKDKANKFPYGNLKYVGGDINTANEHR